MKKIKNVVATVVTTVFVVSLVACEGKLKKIYDYSPENMSNEFSEEYSSMKASFAKFYGVENDEISFGYRTDFALATQNDDGNKAVYAYCATKESGRPYYVKVKDEQEWIYVSDDMVSDRYVKYFRAPSNYPIDGYVYSEKYVIPEKRLDGETESAIGYTTEDIVSIILSEVSRLNEGTIAKTEDTTGIDKINLS